MSVTPKKLLYATEFELKNGKSEFLFKNSSELARILTKEQTSSYFDKTDTVRALLSQSFRDSEHSHSRALPNALKNEILTLIENKLGTEAFHKLGFAERFGVALDELKNRKKREKAETGGLIEEEFRAALTHAKSHFIVNLRPAETIDNEKGNELIKDMLIQLIESDDVYLFFVPSITIASDFWKRLQKEIRLIAGDYQELKEINPKEAKQYNAYIKKINETDILKNVCENKRLRIYMVDIKFCIFPYVIFNYDIPTIRKGFVVYHRGDKGESIGIMSDEYLNQWYNVIYPELRNKENLKEYTYNHFLEEEF